MGRRIPYDNPNISLTPQFLYFSFSFIGLATSIAIITTLCSVRFLRRKPSPRTLSNSFDNTITTPISTTLETTASMFQEQPRTLEATKLENVTIEGNNNEVLIKELPLPPSMQQHNNNNLVNMKRTCSERRLSFNLSMKMPRSLSLARNWDNKKEENNDIGKKEKLKADESIWMKTIILGEKCVPDEEDDGIIYEGKGKRISAYHPRNSVSNASISLSRQCSSTTLDVHEQKFSNI